MLRFVDHVLLLVRDPHAAGVAIADVLSIQPSGGGQHPGRGTANRLAVLGQSYLEYISADPAAGTPPAWTASPAGPAWFAVASDNLDAEIAAAEARGAALSGPVAGQLKRADGTARHWHTAYFGGHTLATQPGALPFLIQHDLADEERAAALAAPESPPRHGMDIYPVVDVTIAMSDLPAGVAQFSQALGLTPGEPYDDALLQATCVDLPLGDGCITIAAPRPDSPRSIVQSRLDQVGEGICAVTLRVHGLPATVAALHAHGLTLQLDGTLDHPRAALPDSGLLHGALIRLIEASPNRAEDQ